MKWMLTVAYRWRPGNLEWQYKTVITKSAPERWIVDALESARLGEGKLDVCVIHSRQIDDEIAGTLDVMLAEASDEAT